MLNKRVKWDFILEDNRLINPVLKDVFSYTILYKFLAPFEAIGQC